MSSCVSINLIMYFRRERRSRLVTGSFRLSQSRKADSHYSSRIRISNETVLRSTSKVKTKTNSSPIQRQQLTQPEKSSWLFCGEACQKHSSSGVSLGLSPSEQ